MTSDRIKIFVEGIADEKFVKDYVKHIKPNLQLRDDDIMQIGGWTTMSSEKSCGESIRIAICKNSDNGGVNLVIFDADNDVESRRKEILDWKDKFNLTFELFLLPNNKDIGALEHLLEKIINQNNKPIFDCWAGYEKCIQSKQIEGRDALLTTPAKKTKIYGYLEALLGTTRKEKELIKERARDYNNVAHWNLDEDYLQPLKDFLIRYL